MNTSLTDLIFLYWCIYYFLIINKTSGSSVAALKPFLLLLFDRTRFHTREKARHEENGMPNRFSVLLADNIMSQEYLL